MPVASGLVVIGAGQASAQLIEVARQNGYAAPITLIGEEPVLPYQRPPLSKQFLAGAKDAAWLRYRPAAFYAGNGVELRLGQRAIAIDRAACSVVLESGDTIAYSLLALVTGARSRRLDVPGDDLDAVYYIRTLADVNRLQPRLADVRRVTIIGAGFIGLEAAAVLVQLGKQVTLLAAQDRVLPKLGCVELSRFLQDEHAKHGVQIIADADVAALNACAGGGIEVCCRNGAVYVSDIVLAGIGAVANTEIAEAAGLECDNGIVVDAFAQTSDATIVAAGDCTNHPSGHSRQRLRLETVHNAVEQGRTAGLSIAGKPEAYVQAPWLWSDQYDLRIQSVGVADEHDQAVTRGSIARGSFTRFYFRQGHLLAATSVNHPLVFGAVRRILNSRIPVTPDEAANSIFDLATLARPQPALDFEIPWPTRAEKKASLWGHA
jgi:3-phenylpropionate/trans-cinnamate dioxygenase ferredoxin reductase component